MRCPSVERDAVKRLDFFPASLISDDVYKITMHGRRVYVVIVLTLAYLLGLATGFYVFAPYGPTTAPGVPITGSGSFRIADGIGFEWAGIWRADFGGKVALISNETGPSVTFQAVLSFEGVLILNFTRGLGTGPFSQVYQMRVTDGKLYLNNYGGSLNYAHAIMRVVNDGNDAWVALNGEWAPAASEGHITFSVSGEVPLTLFGGVPHQGFVIDLNDFNCTF